MATFIFYNKSSCFTLKTSVEQFTSFASLYSMEIANELPHGGNPLEHSQL